MDPIVPITFIVIVAIVMGGLVKIARQWRGAQPQSAALEGRLEAVEQELAALHQGLSETQERLDFAERILAQSPESKRLGASE
jgi:Tfp pilus assembly protein PilN